MLGKKMGMILNRASPTIFNSIIVYVVSKFCMGGQVHFHCTDLVSGGMKHVVLFSGGTSSAYVAYLVLQKFNRRDVVLLHTPTYSENHDADTFRHNCARYLKMPITEWGLGLNVWELIEKNNCIPGQFMPFCTEQLKQKMKDEYYKYLKEIGEDFIEYVGFGSDEWRRVQRAVARNEKLGRKVAFTVFEEKIPGDEIKRIIRDEWKIQLPSAYEELNHNNCVPCFKAGKKSWQIYWKNHPTEFWKASEYEEQIGYTVFKDISLKELAEKWQAEKDWVDSEFILEDYLPCDCWS